jgi:hypothetical protein
MNPEKGRFALYVDTPSGRHWLSSKVWTGTHEKPTFTARSRGRHRPGWERCALPPAHVKLYVTEGKAERSASAWANRGDCPSEWGRYTVCVYDTWFLPSGEVVPDPKPEHFTTGDPARIAWILAELAEYWTAHPTQTLAHVLNAALVVAIGTAPAGYTVDVDLFALEDDALVEFFRWRAWEDGEPPYAFIVTLEAADGYRWRARRKLSGYASRDGVTLPPVRWRFA